MHSPGDPPPLPTSSQAPSPPPTLRPPLPLPVLVSAGVLSTKGIETGLPGYDRSRDQTFFGNFDVLPVKQLAIGVEYKQGASYNDFHNAHIRSIHAAWFATKNLTLIAAYANAGKTTAISSGTIGLGDGLALSARYAF